MTSEVIRQSLADDEVRDVRESTDERGVFLSTLSAGRRDRRLALAAVLVSVVIFLAAASFAQLPLAPVPAFIPIYESALVINDLITAVLLFGQYNILRSRALLVLASSYLFTAFITVTHALTFPGLFSPTGLLGAGPQSTAWLYMFWHGGFPLLVIAYAMLKSEGRETSRAPGRARVAVLSCVTGVLAAVCGLTLLATAGQDLLPAIMRGNRYTPEMIAVVSSVWALSLLALVILWRRRPHAVLDLWLMVVMCAWLFDIALAAVLNAGRFDLGFYAGRIYGLLAASFVLIMLLLESGKLYARLSDSFAGERKQRQLVERASIELMAVNKELDAFSYSVSHDLRAPLRHIDGFAQMLRDECAVALDGSGQRYLGVITESVKQMGQLIDDLLLFSKMGRVEMHQTRVSMDESVKEVVKVLEGECRDRSIEWDIEPLPDVRGDRSMLRQVWVNLLSNSVKYTRPRPVAKIRIGYSKAAGEFYVQDNGAGFEMAYADKLFGVFQRLHRAEEFEGTGVGLANVRRIISRHGGRIRGQGKVDEGATFYFSLPIHQEGHP